MCLTAVTKTDDAQHLAEHGTMDGFKAVWADNPGWHPEYGRRSRKSCPFNEWLRATDYPPSPAVLEWTLGSCTYTPGWHVYLEKPGCNAARALKVVKVKMRSVRLTGKALKGRLAAVCDEIFVEKPK